MTISAIGTALLVALGFWIFGGFALRLGGALLVLVGTVGLATTGNANGLLPLGLGVATWWVGHLHYALRRGVWKSALAGYISDSVAKLWTVRWSRASTSGDERKIVRANSSVPREGPERRADLTRLGRSG